MTKNDVAIVSGANRGIGAAIAKELLARGWRVSLGVRGGQMPEWAKAFDPAMVHAFAYDAATGKDETAWIEAARKALGPIRAVIANAGTIVPKDVISITDDEMAQMMEVNTHSPRRLARAAWSDLQADGQGRVIILASLSAKRVKSALSGSYSVTKYAALALAHGLRHAGFEHGIRATAICPGFVATDMGTALTERPAQEMTRPEDLAALIATVLALPNASSVAELAVNCQDEELY
ncbi:SDR family NAD(P)-dependent oxidoreductase [Xinfangfangia sp. CPCC 101601]|uniref:SDR family NAD(P)-dependent oxidoreductase n=1 Tax=Pseudogemmobacter lacusdianii TaxID=3069608 RepID=A0ABU0W4A0_9RHOB|nr:SDR family NAD(P)-dependent oxidoreductase [Xinfangfangia sp. CPCC 101601]MDQ2067890.1 SDR family NAD(P)-dependent oxidoreductase [Xinfangfangia sp. CPCC 101601]